jgi:hypothetical protein
MRTIALTKIWNRNKVYYRRYAVVLIIKWISIWQLVPVLFRVSRSSGNYAENQNFHILTNTIFKAQNNGRSTDINRQKMPLDRSLFYLTGHFDRPHCHAFQWQCDCWRLELKHETMMYIEFLIVCFTLSVSVSMTDQKQILTELKSSWPVILTDVLADHIAVLAVAISCEFESLQLRYLAGLMV